MEESNLNKIEISFPIGIDGSGFQTALYNGEYVVFRKGLNGSFKIFSQKAVNGDSVKVGEYYRTKVQLEQLSDVYSEKLFARYANNIYEVGKVSKFGTEFELIGRNDKIIEDKQLGFMDDLNFRVSHKFVSRSEISDLYTYRESVYEQLKE